MLVHDSKVHHSMYTITQMQFQQHLAVLVDYPPIALNWYCLLWKSSKIVRCCETEQEGGVKKRVKKGWDDCEKWREQQQGWRGVGGVMEDWINRGWEEEESRQEGATWWERVKTWGRGGVATGCPLVCETSLTSGVCVCVFVQTWSQVGKVMETGSISPSHTQEQTKTNTFRVRRSKRVHRSASHDISHKDHCTPIQTQLTLIWP